MHIMLHCIMTCIRLCLQVHVLSCSPQTVEVSGMKLKTGVAVLYSTKEKTDPKFAMLTKLFMCDGKVLLGLKELEVVQYSEHYHSWIVEPTPQRMILPVMHLPCRQVLTPRPVQATFSKLFVTLHYAF